MPGGLAFLCKGASMAYLHTFAKPANWDTSTLEWMVSADIRFLDHCKEDKQDPVRMPSV